LSQRPLAFEDFAAVKTSADLVSFITKYGPLTREKRQIVLTLLDQAQTMHECMKGKRAPLQSVSLSSLLYQNPKTGEAEVLLTPSSLLDALWLQYQHSQSSGATFRNCPHCGAHFAVGAQQRTSPHRRLLFARTPEALQQSRSQRSGVKGEAQTKVVSQGEESANEWIQQTRAW
jgi:hypothetical protein